MKIPKTFKKDINQYYAGHITFDDLIMSQNHFLRRLIGHALRYATIWMISDHDDLFQEACKELHERMWSWDNTRGPDLATYCVYNIGVKLTTIVKSEKAKKRHPDANRARKINIWEPIDEESGGSYENILPSPDNIEVSCAIKQAIDRAHNELTDIAQDLLRSLANNSGNLTQSMRDMWSQDHIRERYGCNESHMKYVIRKKVLPELANYLHPSRIIP